MTHTNHPIQMKLPYWTSKPEAAGRQSIRRALPLLSMLTIITVITIISCIAMQEVQAVQPKTTELEASGMASRLTNQISNLKEESYPTTRLEDMLAEMKNKIANLDFEGAAETYNQTLAQIEKLRELKEEIIQIDALLAEAEARNINTTNIMRYYTLGMGDYQNNNFESAEPNLDASKQELVKELSPYSTEMKKSMVELLNLSIEKNATSKVLNDTITKIEEYEKKEDYVHIFIELSKLNILNKTTHQIISLSESLSRMKSEGKKTSRFDDSLQEMTMLLEAKDYDGFSQLYDNTTSIMDMTRNLASGISQAEEKLKSPDLEGIDLSEAEELLSISKSEYELENYEKAESYLQRAKERIADLEKEHVFMAILNRTKAQYDPIGFLKKYWLPIIIAAVLLYLLLKLSKSVFKIVIYDGQMRRLEHEQDTIVELMRQLQKDYYMTKEIDRDTYEAEKNNFEKRTSEINKEFPVMTAKIQKEQERLGRIFSITRRRKYKTAKEKRAAIIRKEEKR